MTTPSIRRGRFADPRSRADIVRIVVLSGFVLLALSPYLLMLTTSFKDAAQYAEDLWMPSWPLHFENYARAFDQVMPYMLTSVIVAGSAIIGILALATVAGFVLARYRFPGRRFFFIAIAALLMIPSISSLIPLFLLMRDLGLLNSYAVMVIPHVTGGAVLGTILMKTFIEQIPQALFDAARIDGANGVVMLRSVVLPLSLPIIGTICLVTVNGVWNDFFWPLLTITTNSLRPISVGLLFFEGQSGTAYGPLFAGYILASLPLLVLFTFLSKHFLAGVQGGLPGSH